MTISGSVAMRVEAFEDGAGEFPADSLRRVETVADLIGAFETWARPVTVRFPARST